MKAAAKDLEPGSSVFDHDHPERVRMVHSVTTLRGNARVRNDAGEYVPSVRVAYGHPQGDPLDELGHDGGGIGVVAADKEFEVIADASGQRL